MDVTGVGREQEEGGMAEKIEKRTSRLPSDLFLWSGLACAATSLGFLIAGRKHTSLFVGQWVPTLLLFGVYNKIVKTAGHDIYKPSVH